MSRFQKPSLTALRAVLSLFETSWKSSEVAVLLQSAHRALFPQNKIQNDRPQNQNFESCEPSTNSIRLFWSLYDSKDHAEPKFSGSQISSRISRCCCLKKFPIRTFFSLPHFSTVGNPQEERRLSTLQTFQRNNTNISAKNNKSELRISSPSWQLFLCNMN